MIKLDIDTIQLFKGDISEDKCICFYGEREFTWNILYKQDLSAIRSYDFYQIINPANSQLIQNLYIFNFIVDALIFYRSKHESFFQNSLIVILDHQTKSEVAQILKKRFNDFKGKAPKLHFYHRNEKADLFLFYLEMLGLQLDYKIEYNSNDLLLHIKHKSLSLSLSFRELTRLRFFLGINDKTFRIKNTVLSLADTKQIINW